MKPRTKIQHRIMGLSKNLSPISQSQKQFAFSKVLRHVGHRSKKGITCMDCGEFYEDTTTHKRSTCPHCNTRLEIELTRKKKFSQREYMAIVNVIEGIQISRTFEINSWHQSGTKVQTHAKEIFQHWFNVEGKTHIVARQRNSFFNNDSFTGDMEIRNHKNACDYRYSVSKVCPRYKVLPIFKKLGFKGNFHWLSPYSFFTEIEHNNKAETLLKAGQGELFQYAILHSGSAYNYWNSIKICIRNKYIVKDASMYYDYLRLLQRLGRDLSSPKYVCPKDLKKEHDRYVLKVRDIDRKKQEEARIKRMEESQKNYESEKKAFFGICFIEGDLSVKVLESVQEFYEQADIHRHCVFANEYYSKTDSLIMAAYKAGVPVETVEIQLSTMEILQSRGFNNNTTEHNKKIRRVVSKNIGKIRQIYERLQSAN